AEVFARKHGRVESLFQLKKLLTRCIEHLRFRGLQLRFGDSGAQLTLVAPLQDLVITERVKLVGSRVRVGCDDIASQVPNIERFCGESDRRVRPEGGG